MDFLPEELTKEPIVDLIRLFESRHQASIDSFWRINRQCRVNAGRDVAVEIFYSNTTRYVQIYERGSDEYFLYALLQGGIRILGAKAKSIDFVINLLETAVDHFDHRYQFVDPDRPVVDSAVGVS